jgi:hypothetical protein
LGRVLGIVAIVAGTLVIGIDPDHFDIVLFSLPIRQGHGVHLDDVLGFALVVLGTALLWFAPPRSAQSSA